MFRREQTVEFDGDTMEHRTGGSRRHWTVWNHGRSDRYSYGSFETL